MQRRTHLHLAALAGCLALAAWGSRAALANTSPNTTAIPGWTTQDFLGRTPLEQLKAALSIVGLVSLLMFAFRWSRSEPKSEK